MFRKLESNHYKKFNEQVYDCWKKITLKQKYYHRNNNRFNQIIIGSLKLPSLDIVECLDYNNQ